jgi:nicotinic acid phosphoribosyltransferase
VIFLTNALNQSMQMNAVEYALDIIEELRMQPEGLEYLSEYHVSSDPSTLLQ